MRKACNEIWEMQPNNNALNVQPIETYGAII